MVNNDWLSKQKIYFKGKNLRSIFVLVCIEDDMKYSGQYLRCEWARAKIFCNIHFLTSKMWNEPTKCWLKQCKKNCSRLNKLMLKLPLGYIKGFQNLTWKYDVWNDGTLKWKYEMENGLKQRKGLCLCFVRREITRQSVVNSFSFSAVYQCR